MGRCNMRRGDMRRSGMRLLGGLGTVSLTCALLCGQDDGLAAKSQAAKQALLANRYGEAIALYRQLAAALPSNAGLRLDLGLALEKGGQPAAAIPELEGYLRAVPDSGAAWLLLGLAHQQLGHPRDAIVPLRTAVKLDPRNTQAQLELADAELASGNPRDAAENFRKLAAAHPDMAKAWQGLGLSYLASGERALARVRDLAPQSAFSYALAARAQAAEGHYPEALNLYQAAIQASPSLPGLHAARASIYRATGQTGLAAEEEAREARIPRPDCTTDVAACACLAGEWTTALAQARASGTPSNLYWASIASGKLAEESFSRLAALPESAEIHELLAEANQRLGRRTDAVEEWRKALAKHPEDRHLQGRLAESLLKNREYEEACRLLEPLVKSSPDNAEWQYLLGETLFEQRRAEEALGPLETAQRLRPDHLPTMEGLGRAYLELGQPERAIPLLERALPVDEGPIEFALSSAYRRVGRDEDAKAALARYREITKLSGGSGAADLAPPQP
jgi:predicted Zn-dependent protease